MLLAAWLLVVAAAGLGPGSLLAQARPRAQEAAGAVAGTVLDARGEPVAGARIELVEIHRVVQTDAEGRFRFAGVPAGTYMALVESEAAGTDLVRLTVAAGEETEVVLRPRRTTHSDAIVVTAGFGPRSRLEVVQPTTVMDDDELLLRREASLGETLSKEPGIHSTYFGPGASRPVIRGLGGDRVRMLENGVGTGDASATSPDHAVSAEPLAAERIEVILGPATLLYGSSAVGGVVNVISETIPGHRPTEPLSGEASLRAGSVADELSGSLSLTGGAGSWAWTAGALARDSGDVAIPGFAASAALAAADPEAAAAAGRGTIANSGLSTQQGSAGLSYLFGDSGYLGLAMTGLDSEYGIPGAFHGGGNEEPEADDEAVRIDMRSRRLDLGSEGTRAFGPFRGFKARLGLVDYEHEELEGAVVGTRVAAESWEGRLELVQKPRGRLSGAFGVQAGGRDLAVTGDEAFLPATTRRDVALFAFEEIAAGDLRYQLGARFERQETDAAPAELPDRELDAFSASFGVVWRPGAGSTSVGGNLSRAVKAPSPEELYSDGVHAATQTFDLGDPALGQEVSHGLDLFVRHGGEGWDGELTLFWNRFDDFIYQRATGEEREGAPVVGYRQEDADFWGAELAGRVGLVEEGEHHLDLHLSGDLVRAQLAGGEAVPRIPPMRLGVGLWYRVGRWSATTEVRWVDAQERVAASEPPTPGYTMLDASLGYRWIGDHMIYDLLLRGTNLTDEEARNHVSFLKDRVPLPGRDVSLALRLVF